jgi:hypothetical protein
VTASERTAELMVQSIAADLQQSLGGQAWRWHDERVGEVAAVPLSWLAQIQQGVSLLQAAAQREPGLRLALAAEHVRADAADEESARQLSTLREVEQDLAVAEARYVEAPAPTVAPWQRSLSACARRTVRIRDLEGDDEGRNTDEALEGYQPFDGDSARSPVR